MFTHFTSPIFALIGITFFLSDPCFATSVKGLAIQAEIEAAAQEYKIPKYILQAIAEVESGSIHRDEKAGAEDAAPPSYGVMGLRDDAYFGHSLETAAQLLQENKQILRDDYHANIRGAAALLNSFSVKNKKDLRAWRTALETYSGIPTAVDAELYADQVLQRAETFSPRAVQVSYTKSIPQIHWDPSPHTGGILNPQFIVIHTTESSLAAARSWFKNPNSMVSAHYLVGNTTGDITQMVDDHTVAYHARCWNDRAIGIEHEARSSDGSGMTQALYDSSAALVRYLAQKYNIPLDAQHIIGHDFWQTEEFKQSPLDDCQDHNDPGRFWNWEKYFARLIGRT